MPSFSLVVFVGVGEDYYATASLKYDIDLGGYRVGVTEDQLKSAPEYNRNTEWDWSDRSTPGWSRPGQAVSAL
jgi:hypothetical protein